MTRMSARIPHQLEKFAGLRLEPPRFSESLGYGYYDALSREAYKKAELTYGNAVYLSGRSIPTHEDGFEGEEIPTSPSSGTGLIEKVLSEAKGLAVPLKQTIQFLKEDWLRFRRDLQAASEKANTGVPSCQMRSCLKRWKLWRRSPPERQLRRMWACCRF